MENIQQRLKRKKKVFLIWAIIECCIFLFTELIIDFFKTNTPEFYLSYERNHVWIALIIKTIQLLGFIVLFRIIYEINEMLAIPILKFSTDFESFSEQAKKVNEKLDELNVSSTIGIIKEIEEPTIWEFSDKVIGWNPNWSIELSSTHPNGRKLREIHTSRIVANVVKEVEYIFFENYKIDNGNHECFGIDFFLKTLKKIDDDYRVNHAQNKNAVRHGVKKYKIWIVPESIHTNKQLPYYDELKTFKNFIFLCGHKEGGENNMIIFINKKGFVVNNYHKYFIEIFGSNQIYTDLNEHFTHITQLLSQSSIKYKTVEYDNSKNEFQIV